MSDALCGPSNALQNFQKHASTDRTLQQDRLTSQQTPSQGFRNHNPSTGVLDPEFAAFESNLAPAPLGDLQHPAHLAAPAPQLFLSGPSESLNWATDFQRLNIADPWAVHHQQPNVSHAPLPSTSQQGWHNEFLQHQHQQQPTMQHHHPLAHTEDFESSFRPSDRNMHLMRFHPQRAGLAPQVSSAATTAAAAPSISTFDESAFEAAFAQASAAIASQETATETVAAEEITTTPQQDTDDLTTKAQAPIEQIKIGSDTIPPTEKSTDPQAQANDADALARTAGQLVDSLKHDTSQKFQESNFLALMRRIRDREVEIKGEEFQETSQTLHPGGRYYPEGQRRAEMADGNGSGSGSGLGAGSTDPAPQSSSNMPSQRAPATESVDASPAAMEGTLGDAGLLSETWSHGDRWA